jgi:hypothetical protein
MALWALTIATFVCGTWWSLTERSEDKTAHAKCIAHIASVVSNKFLAERMRELADKWDTSDEMSEHNRIANTLYKPGGPSVPAIWLREKADQIEQGDL